MELADYEKVVIAIVTNAEREILETPEGYFIYIPLTEEEIKAFNIQTKRPAWRIRINK